MKCIQCKALILAGHHTYCTGLEHPEDVIHLRCSEAWHRAKRGLTHTCPKCSTSGKIDDPKGRTETRTVPLGPGETPSCAYGGCRGCGMCMNDQKNATFKVQVTCNLCKGEGYLAKEPTPISKIVDWKL